LNNIATTEWQRLISDVEMKKVTKISGFSTDDFVNFGRTNNRPMTIEIRTRVKMICSSNQAQSSQKLQRRMNVMLETVEVSHS